MADDVMLSREEELKKWNKPYVFRPYPKMLYRGRTLANGSLDVEQRVVASEQDEALAGGAGWLADPSDASAAEVRRQEDVGTAAAERAWADRRMTAPAQAEAAAVDAATAKHLGEIPDEHKRPHRRKE